MKRLLQGLAICVIAVALAFVLTSMMGRYFIDNTVIVAAPSTTEASSTTTTTQNVTTTTGIYYHAITNPELLVIPSIQLKAHIENVGINPDGSMEVPQYQFAGWFSVGPAPGEKGAAVIDGHVSWHGQKGVFFGLKSLRKGDSIAVYDLSGDCAIFIVDEVEVTLKTELPTQKIWMKTQEPLLRLITCGGEFDKSIGHYLSNVIVYAHLEK
jgi:hypothetical protein